jgi:imidazolonepropionase-like amidohydrolase
MLDQAGQVGVVAPGAFADIIAVDGDPLREIKLLENVRFVMKDGAVFKQ